MRLKMEISGLSVLEFISRAQSVVDHMMDNAALFPAPPVDPATTVHTAIDQLRVDNQAALTRDKEKIAIRNAQKEVVENYIRQLAGYVQGVSAGDPLVIQAGGFFVADPGEPVGRLDATQLKARFSGFPGEVALKWNRLKGARAYIIEQTMEDPANAETQWEIIGESTKSAYLVEDLIQGSMVWFRVYGVNAAGKGIPSDPAKSIVG